MSPAYVPDPIELDEHVPVYVPEPEYHAPSDDDIQVEDQPYADNASPTAESPGYIADSDSIEEDIDEVSIDNPDEPEDGEEDDDEDLEDDPSEEHEPEDKDDNDDTDDEDEEPTEEEKEHLASANSFVVNKVQVKDTLDNASSAVTYISISFDSNGPSSWGIPLVNTGELPEMDPYEEPEHPKYHAPSDDDIQVMDQPYSNDASPTAESPRYIADSDSMEEDTDEVSIDNPDEPEDGKEDDDEDPEEDPSEEHEPEDEDDNDDTDDEDEEPTKDEEEEHLAPADSFVVPIVDPVPSAGDTTAFETDESAPTPRSPQTMVPFSQTRLCKA
ncbi:hypothetical protein Tco_1279922 [Tanacetum coccineum]